MKKLADCSRMYGHTLITGLMLLFILIIFSLAGVDAAVLESRMASGFRERGQLFQRAESALRFAEELIIPTLEINDLSTSSKQQPIRFVVPLNDSFNSELANAGFDDPMVSIEKVATIASKVRGKLARNPDANESKFRVTAYAAGPTRGAQSRLISVVVRSAQN